MKGFVRQHLLMACKHCLTHTYSVIKQIGSGQFGTVSIGKWLNGINSELLDVAVKTVKATSDIERIKLLQEAAIMGQFAHRNVVRLLGVVTVGEPVSDPRFIYTIGYVKSCVIICT